MGLCRQVESQYINSKFEEHLAMHLRLPSHFVLSAPCHNVDPDHRWSWAQAEILFARKRGRLR